MRIAYQSDGPIGASLVRGDGSWWDWDAGAWGQAPGAAPEPRHWRAFAALGGPVAGGWVLDLPRSGGTDLADGGRRWGSYRFSGEDYHQVSRPDWCVTADRAFTWMAWVKGPAGQADRTLLCEGSATDPVPLFRLFVGGAAGAGAGAGAGAVGTIGADLRYQVGAQAIALGSRVLLDNQWHHVAATCDGHTLTLYSDGQADGTSTVAGMEQLAVNLVGFGALTRGDVQRAFSGALDDVRSYPRCLTAVEVKAAAGRWLNGPSGAEDVTLSIWALDAGGKPSSTVNAIQLSLITPAGALPGGCGA